MEKGKLGGVEREEELERGGEGGGKSVAGKGGKGRGGGNNWRERWL